LPGNPVHFDLGVHDEPSMVARRASPFLKLEYFRPAEPGKGKLWRELAVEVRPSGVRFFWEGRYVRSVSRTTFRELAKKLVQRPADPVPEFAPREGLGLYVETSAASFRNVVLEPLGEENDEP
jgi:hypothetical protein